MMQWRGSVERRAVLGGCAALMIAPALASARDGAPDLWELPVPDMERLGPTVWVKPLAIEVWITCFTFDAPGLGWVPCNGLIIGGSGGVTLVDTGNTAEQGRLLIETASRLTGGAVARAIATHFHADRTGGIAALRAADVPVFAHPYTIGLAQAYGERVPEPVRGLEKGPVVLGPVELFYPGPAHTRDNITVWHAPSRTLFGGCMLRATTDKQMSSRADAELASYAASVDRLVARYPERRFTVPGHGTIAGDSLLWTRQLAAALR